MRQPLRHMIAVVPGKIAIDSQLLDLLRDELNVKTVEFRESAAGLVHLTARPNFAALGPRFQARTEAVARAIRALPADRLAACKRGDAVAVVVDGQELDLEPGDLEVLEEALEGRVVKSEGGFTVALDPTVDQALREEGLARELVNRIQRLRREAGFEITDRIRLAIVGPAEVVQAALRFREFIAGETLAADFQTGSDGEEAGAVETATSAGEGAAPAGYDKVSTVDLDGLRAKIAVAVHGRAS
ncbi:MAG: hypothetical protein HY701_03840 [Gemmatimonadetes bacterium]|nr:hypothetical protein [Gemmatimonadota bacterium]